MATGAPAKRTPEEIRASIEQNRVELGTAVERLRVEVARLTDWRAQLRQQRATGVDRRRRRRVRARRRHRGDRRADVRAPAPQAARRLSVSPATSSGSRPRRAAPARRGCRSPGRSRRSRAARTPKISVPRAASSAASSGAWMCWTIQPSAPASLHGAQQVDHPLERPPRGAHALDRGDLGLDRQDRLDPERRPEPRLRAGDPPAAPQVFERVDREPHLQPLRARRARAHSTSAPPAPPRAAAAAAMITSPSPPQAVAESNTNTREARSPSCSRACCGGADGARHAAREVDRDDLVAGVEQRLVDLEEVADRRLRRGRQLGLGSETAGSRRRSRRSRSRAARPRASGCRG